MRTPADSILAYLRAKDGNRPHLMTQAFTEDASLAILFNTGTISSQPLSGGRDAIADPRCIPERVMHGAPHISDLRPVLDYIVKEGGFDNSSKGVPRPTVSCRAS